MLYEKENLILNAIETNSQNRGINNLIRLWSGKIRDNLEYFLDDQELVIKMDEIDQKISELESKIESKKKEIELKKQKQKENMDRAYIKNRELYADMNNDINSNNNIRLLNQPKNKVNKNNNFRQTSSKPLNYNNNNNNNNIYNINNSNKNSIRPNKYNIPNANTNKKYIDQSKNNKNINSIHQSNFDPNKKSISQNKFYQNNKGIPLPNYNTNKKSIRQSKYDSTQKSIKQSKVNSNKSSYNKLNDSKNKNSITQSKFNPNKMSIKQSNHSSNKNSIKQSKYDPKNKDISSSKRSGRNFGVNYNKEERKAFSDDKVINKNKNNLENYSFHYSPEKLGENILQISKKNKNIISYIDIDIFFQRIAEDKKIYDDMNNNDTLLNGFCIQHSIFIPTSIFVSKIISCFNYFYSKYLNLNGEENKSGENIIESFINKNGYPYYGYRDKYKKTKNLAKIPYSLIDLLILFVDWHEKYNKELMTKEVIDKIENFYNNMLFIYDIKIKYERDINYSNMVLRRIKNSAMIKRARLHGNTVAFDYLFPKKNMLNNIIRDPSSLSFFNILEYESYDIAKELTRISENIISKIEPKEFFKGVFTKKNKEVTSPNITEITNRFNKLSFWVIEEILSYDYAKERAEVIEKFIDISNELVNLNNFNDSMSMVSALGQIIVADLAKTWKFVSKESKTVLQNLKNFLNFQDNYKNIRDSIDECLQNNEPYIPFMGPYNKRICFLEEYGPYVKDNYLVNVDKIVLVQQILDQFYKCKLKRYEFVRSHKNELIIFQCLDPAEEDELETLGSFIEPIFALNKIKNHEKRITNTERNFRENYEQKIDLI